MLRIMSEEYREDVHKKYIVATCSSTDTKPGDGYLNGSVLIEVDTGDVYLYNEDDNNWVKQ